MRFEIRKSGGETCKLCGAHELLHVPHLAQHLEADIREALLKEVPSWQVARRRRCKQLIREMDKAIAELRSKTRYQVS